MSSIADAEVEAILTGHGEWLAGDDLEGLATHPLSCIQTEYPHFVFAVDGPDDLQDPSTTHPIFFGCYDWHSAVHSHWSLVRQCRLFDDHPSRESIITTIDQTLTHSNAEVEATYFEEHPHFERPYGWGWLLRLDAELALWDTTIASRWRNDLEPLVDTIIELVETEFLTLDRPLRVGTHANSAFGLGCIIDYARVVGASDLEVSAVDTARSWYLEDTSYRFAYEPLGWDFLSPGLLEIEVMARVLEPDAFADWLDGFAPDLTAAETILTPVEVDPADGDGRAMHLVGLNLSRAWSFAELAAVVDDDGYTTIFEDAAGRHASVGLEDAFIDDYAGAHWLTSFALYLLTRNAGGIGLY